MTIVLGNPEGLRLVHLLLADLLWVVLVVLISARFEMATGTAGVVGADRDAGGARQRMPSASGVGL